MRFLEYIKEDRYYAEVRVFEDGDDYVNYSVDGRTKNAAFNNAKNYAKKNLKGEGKIKINVHDREHPKGNGWIIMSKEVKI